MLQDLLVGLAEESEGLEVVDEVLSHKEVSEQLRSACSHIVVFRQDHGGLPTWAADLLDRHPRLRFLGLDAAGRRADLFELRLAHTRIDEISADALTAALYAPEPGLEPQEPRAGC